MIKRVKSWVYAAAMLGGTMYLLNGCLGLGENGRLLLAILQEDIFG